ncbi:protein S100-A12-like [Dromiciops gliroides]|uniref:protein S100-A12-like n=1 Tax=Dromiciops gliroides TaxID=33562 RepID=UPI001CC52C14|nr:protein S100-A12-like [Dromiciops gliroides]
MTDLEKSCEMIVNIFHQYSVRVDDFDTLSFSEFNRLVKEQFPNWLGKIKDPDFSRKTFESTDKNKDKQISFREFVNLLVPLIEATHETENLPIHPSLTSPDEAPLQTNQNSE